METAASGTAVPEALGGAAASTTFQLEVNTLAGGCLAAIPDAQGSWQLRDVLRRLPEVLPGHKYDLLKGEAVLAPGTAIARWAQPVDGRAFVTAVVVPPQTLEEQWQLNAALIKAAGALDVEKVRELLSVGADARHRCAFPTDMTALRQAFDALGSRMAADRNEGERDKEEEECRLQLVMGALLSARADVDARRREVGLGRTFNTCVLHVAVQYSSLGPVRMLLDARASVDAVSQENLRGCVKMECESTALHMATQAGSVPLVTLLLERAANVNAVRRCLKWEEDVERRDGRRAADRRRPVEERETALHLAVAGGHLALVALLVQAGADASIARSRGGEETSLEELCAGNPEMLDAINVDTSEALLAGAGEASWLLGAPRLHATP